MRELKGLHSQRVHDETAGRETQDEPNSCPVFARVFVFIF